jgi:NADH-quinone oxidoreductase subunit J
VLTWALFLIVAAGTGAAALGVALTGPVVRSAVCLLGALVGVSLCFFLLGAEFLGAAQLIVYVGGTLVLLVFGGMLTAGGPRTVLPPRRWEWVAGGLLALSLFALLATVSLRIGDRPAAGELPGTGPLGLAFLGIPEKPGGVAYLLPFEVVSVHLLVVLVGAAYLARAGRRATA